MALLSDPAQPQRFSLLAPDVAASIRQFQAMPVPAAPAQAPQRARVSGWRLLDRVLGGETVSEGLDAERARLQAEAERPQVQARMQAMRIAAERMGPEAMIAFNTNPEAFGESLGMQFRPVTTAAGSQTNYGPSPFAFRVEQPTFAESGDQTLRRSSAGVQPVYTRTAPSITEQVNQGELGVKRQLANQAQQQFGQRLELDRSRFASDEAYRQAQLDLENQKFQAGLDAPRPGDNEDRAAIVGFEAANARFATQLRNIAGDPQTGAPPLFDLSPASTAAYKAQLATNLGMTPEAAAYGDYVSEIEAAVSESLRLNVGPQTDQDAIREARALLSNVDNKDYVMRRLPTVIANNERLRAGRERLLLERRPNTGPSPAPTPDPLEGRTAVNDSGQRLIRRNGQWVRQ
jgi:hypothetical protein